METEFYSIKYGDKFLNREFTREDNTNVFEAIRFKDIHSAIKHMKLLRKDMGFRIVRVVTKFEVTEVKIRG